MTEVVSVRFRSGCKTYYFNPGQLSIEAGQDLIVETAQGAEYVTCVEGNHPVEDHQVVEPLRRVLRAATENDRRSLQLAREKERDAFAVCQKKIAQHGLEMKLVRVECSFDSNKILFFFTADGRVDFRELVKDLASAFHARIELRQIGVRDEAKMLGGLGICGRPFCCSQFMDDFIPVSIKMAKTQNLSLNPTKISGTCGRLMCCLKYEQDAYEDAVKRMPKNESFVQTPDGPGNVSAVNLLKEQVTVRLDSQPDSPRCYHNCEVCVLRNGKGSRDGIQVPQERPARLVVEEEPEEFPAVVSDFRFTPPEPTAPAADEGREGGRPGRNRRRRGGRGRGGEERSAERKPTEQAEKAPKAEKTEKSDKPRSNRRRGGKKPDAAPQGQKAPAQKTQPQKPQPPKAQAPAGDAPAKKPRHRGGRRHNRRGGAGGGEKTEA